MKNNISEAQSEVWEWKEQAYKEIKHLKGVERLKFILEQTASTITELKKKQRKLKAS